MAKQKHLDIISQGIDAWNTWRSQNPLIAPSLSRADFSKANLSGADLNFANMSRTDLREANLSGANLRGADLTRARLAGANLSGADLSVASLTKANLKDADLSEANLSTAYLEGTNLSNASLFRANMFEAYLVGANLVGANLVGANLWCANLSSANLSGATLGDANLRDADLSGANLSKADLNSTVLIRTNFTNAALKDCSVYGISVWDVQLDGAEQLNLRITPEDQPAITVDNLKVAQFVYLLLNNQELRAVLNSVMERGVLLLGRFGGGGLEELKAMATKLREYNYLPMIFDFERPDQRDFTETVLTLAGLSRFVIADLSGPSVPNELRATIPHIKIPFAPIIEEGRKVYAMFFDLLGYPWVLSPIEFRSKEHLLEVLFSKVIQPAEEKFKERQTMLNQIFDRNP